MSEHQEVPFKSHPIQLIGLHVKELHIKANEAPDITVGVESEEGGLCSISVGHGEFVAEDSTISVALKLEIGETDQEPAPPFSMKIELMATFKVDVTRFDIQYITDFARRNAPYIMMPYLREHAFALSGKCGFRPIILPLTEVPVSKPQA